MMVKQKKSLQETTDELGPVTIERAVYETDMRPVLEEVKKCEGVIGFILRNTTSATIDLNDPTKLIDYAILSSSAFEASEQMSQLFDIGRLKNIIVEGKDAKTLHLTVNENNISIFMDKSTDVQRILEKVNLP